MWNYRPGSTEVSESTAAVTIAPTCMPGATRATLVPLLEALPSATRSSCSSARTRRLTAGPRRPCSPLRLATAKSPLMRIDTMTKATTVTATSKTASIVSLTKWT